MRFVAITALALASLAAAGCAGRGDSGTQSGEIAFTVNTNGWNEIWVMAADGSDRRRITAPRPAGVDAAGSSRPAWSPDGTRIAYVSTGTARGEDENDDEIYVVDLRTRRTTRITRNDVVDLDPAWSIDGKRIVFVRAFGWGTAQTRTAIYETTGERPRERRLYPADAPDTAFLAQPRWSPDGGSLAFTRATLGPAGATSGAVYELGAHSRRARLLIADAAEPAWSPNGRQIAFVRAGEGRTCFHECSASGDIYVADSDGSHIRPVTRDAAHDSQPAWSPDGSELVFASDRAGRLTHRLELYVASTNGGSPRRITDNAVWDLEPSWRP